MFFLGKGALCIRMYRQNGPWVFVNCLCRDALAGRLYTRASPHKHCQYHEILIADCEMRRFNSQRAEVDISLAAVVDFVVDEILHVAVIGPIVCIEDFILLLKSL